MELSAGGAKDTMKTLGLPQLVGSVPPQSLIPQYESALINRSTKLADAQSKLEAIENASEGNKKPPDMR